jgi:F-type H+-transporting ATPase subunit a
VSFLLADVVQHLSDRPIFGRWFTAHHAILLLTAAAMIVGFRMVARRVAAGAPKKGLPALVEVALVWLRDEVVYAWLGPEHGRKYLYYFWSLFFFILCSNLIGLFPFPLNPFHRTATGNVMVTAALALLTFVLVQVAGMREHGALGYWLRLVPHGVPWWLFPLVWLIEFFGLIVKPFALTVRLFANMTAGHAILAVLFGFFLGVAHYGNVFVGALSSVAAFGFALFIMLFETLVALIQAYIFTVLSAIFVSLAVAEEH